MSQVRSVSISLYHPSVELLHPEVVVGNQTFSLIVDTGSSNTWVGARTKYVPSESSTPAGGSVGAGYSFGSFTGQEYTDKARLVPIVCCAICQPYDANVGDPWRPDCDQTIHWCRTLYHRFRRR